MNLGLHCHCWILSIVEKKVSTKIEIEACVCTRVCSGACVYVCHGHHPQDSCLHSNKTETTAVLFESRIVFLFKHTNCFQVVLALTAVPTRVTFRAPQGGKLFLQLFLQKREQWHVDAVLSIHRRQLNTRDEREVEDRRIGSTGEKMFLSLLFCAGNNSFIFCCCCSTVANTLSLESLHCNNPILPSGWRWSESKVNMTLFL